MNLECLELTFLNPPTYHILNREPRFWILLKPRAVGAGIRLEQPPACGQDSAAVSGEGTLPVFPHSDQFADPLPQLPSLGWRVTPPVGPAECFSKMFDLPEAILSGSHTVAFAFERERV